MTKLNDTVHNLIERVGTRFFQATGQMKLKDEDGLKDLPTLEAKVDIIDNQLSLTVTDVTVPIRIAHVFDHVYAFRFDTSTLPKANFDIDDIFKQTIEIFQATKPEVLKIVCKDIWHDKITFDIENTDGRCNRKFSKTIRSYMALRRRIEFVKDLQMIISKAVAVKYEPNTFLFTMKNNDEITLFAPEEFQSTDSILSYIDKNDASLVGFGIKINRYDQYSKLITHRRFNTWRPEQW